MIHTDQEINILVGSFTQSMLKNGRTLAKFRPDFKILVIVGTGLMLKDMINLWHEHERMLTSHIYSNTFLDTKFSDWYVNKMYDNLSS